MFKDNKGQFNSDEIREVMFILNVHNSKEHLCKIGQLNVIGVKLNSKYRVHNINCINSSLNIIDKKEQYLVSVEFRYTVTDQCKVTHIQMIYGYVISPTSRLISL